MTRVWRQRIAGVVLGLMVGGALVYSGAGYFSVFFGPFIGLLFLVLGRRDSRLWRTWTAITLFSLAFLSIASWLIWLWMNSLAHPQPG